MTKTISRCLWCNSNSLEIFTHRKDGVGILKCKKCGLYMVNEVPEDLEEAYYNETYYNSNSTNIDTGYSQMYDLMAPAFLLWQNSLIEELNESHDKKSFLEIGCATGNLLEIIKNSQNNLEIEGIDVSEYAVKSAISKGLKAKTAYIENYNGEKKDIIFSSETMEHLDNLKSFLSGVKNNLKKDGVFLFYVPSISVEDALNDRENYIRFNTNLEHLLHFTPEFLKKELSSFFGSKILIKEFVTGFGPCVVGAVSGDDKKFSDIKKIFRGIETSKLPINPSDVFLKNLAIISLKFANFELAQKSIDVLENRKVDNSTISLIRGLYGYHNGNLVSSNEYFTSYLKANPGSILAIKSILSNEIEINKLLAKEVNKYVDECKDLRVRVLDSESRLRRIKQSFFIRSILKSRRFIKTVYNKLFRFVRRVFNKIVRIIIGIIPVKIRPLLKYVIKLEWLIKTETIKNKLYDKNTPIVSVVIPYYNLGLTIDETISSLKRQTYKNFEVILVDDGSTDQISVDKLKHIDSTGLKFKVINQKNQGVASARNNGIKRAKGKYIICLDADDILSNTYIEKGLIVMEADPNIDLVTTDMNIFGVRNQVYKQSGYKAGNLIENNMVITAAMFKKDAWSVVGGYKSNLGYEDWEFWINLAENGYWGKKISESLFNYRTAMVSRYIDDQSKHLLNIQKIKSFHKNYHKQIKHFNRHKYFNKKTISFDDIFVNLNNPDHYTKGNGDKPNVLIAMPWMTFGGAETLVFNFCNEIKEDFNLHFITGLRSENEWEYKFLSISDYVYHLANLFDNKDLYLDFISNYITIHNIDILHVIHTDFLFKYIPEIKKRHPDIKIIITMFNDRVPSYFNPSVIISNYVDEYVSDNIATSDHFKRELGANKEVATIPNGVDCLNKFNPKMYNRSIERKQLGLQDDEIAVFFVGRLSEEKNPDVFIEVAKRILKNKNIEKIKFFIIGDGPMRQQIKKQIETIKSDSVKYLGYQNDIPRFLSASDIFILPSSIEGFPLSILEAMSMEVAVVASNVGAVSDVIENNKDGFIVEVNSKIDNEKIIIKLATNKSLLLKIKKNARLKVINKYSNTVLKENYTKLYKDILK